MRSVAIAALALMAAGWSAAMSSGQETPAAEGDFRAAWLAFTAPTSASSEGQTEEARQQARQEARRAGLERMEAAAQADPGNALYQIALAHICLAAGDHPRAKEAADRAIELRKDDALPYLLRGQAEAALVQAEPEKAAERIESTVKAFDEAARRDPENALPLLLAASVAFGAGREDLALPRIKAGLGRPGLVLSRLPVPFDLHADPKASIDAWQYVQYGQWMVLLEHCGNASKGLLVRGAEKLAKDDPEGAKADFRAALAVGRMVGRSEPSLFITTHIAINIMEAAYARLYQAETATGSREAERWRGEMGVLQIGRGELYGKLQVYLKVLSDSPPGSVEDLLALEAAGVERTLLGIGITPPAGQEAPPAESGTVQRD